MYTLAQCGGLHGHAKVAPDGTVYVPNKNCPDPDMNPATNDGGQGFAVSEDNGLTWTVRALPGSGSGDSDPAIGIGAGGRIYFAYTASNKHIRVAVSDDKGRTWKYDQDIGLNVEILPGVRGDITASVFPSAVAGDNNRAAVFFHGTGSTAPGNPTGDDTGTVFAGTWFPYIATTCNGGQSWTVVRAGDAVQQGVVCTSGTTCPSGTRNLLDFMDVQVDRSGRVVAAYADGCITQACVNTINGTKANNDKTEVTTIARQISGSRLFADFDANGPSAPPAPPPVEIETGEKGNQLSWQTPDSGCSPITGYKIYRGESDGSVRLLATVAANIHSYPDVSKRKAAFYQVTVLNQYGESPRRAKFYPTASRQ
jgi:hypothetical protein